MKTIGLIGGMSWESTIPNYRLLNEGENILGCTEISLLVGKADAAVPLFYTTIIHARASVALALTR